MIENPTKEQIEEYLAKIGWSLRHHGCDHYYFYNYKKKFTPLCFYNDRIQIESKNFDETPDVCFYLKDVVMEMLDDNCINFGGKNDKSIFIQLRNYKIKK